MTRWPVARFNPLVVGGRERRRAGHKQPRTPQCPARKGSCSAAAANRWYIVGTPNNIVAGPASSRAAAVRREGAEVVKRATAAQRTEHADHEPVHMEQRQAVDEHVPVGPFPRFCQSVEVSGDRPPGQHDAFRWTGRARGVDDERGRLLIEVVVNLRAPLGATSIEVDLEGAAARRAPAATRHRRQTSTAPGSLSETTCTSSRSPDFGLIGTMGTFATSAPTTAAQVSSLGWAHTATAAGTIEAPRATSAATPWSSAVAERAIAESQRLAVGRPRQRRQQRAVSSAVIERIMTKARTRTSGRYATGRSRASVCVHSAPAGRGITRQLTSVSAAMIEPRIAIRYEVFIATWAVS